MGPSRAVSETAISVENLKIFLSPCILRPAEWVPPGIGYRRRGSKNQNDEATGSTKKFDNIFSRLDTIHQRYRHTDGQADTGRQQRPRLRIASRCKTCWNYSSVGISCLLISNYRVPPIFLFENSVFPCQYIATNNSVSVSAEFCVRSTSFDFDILWYSIIALSYMSIIRAEYIDYNKNNKTNRYLGVNCSHAEYNI